MKTSRQHATRVLGLHSFASLIAHALVACNQSDKSNNSASDSGPPPQPSSAVLLRQQPPFLPPICPTVAISSRAGQSTGHALRRKLTPMSAWQTAMPISLPNVGCW